MRPDEQAQDLLTAHGVAWSLPDYVVGAAFDERGRLALALGNGSVHLHDPRQPGEHQVIAVHEGGCLSLAAVPGGGFLSGGDDGCLCALAADGTRSTLHVSRGQWVEHVAAARGGLVACGIGRHLHLFLKGKALARHTYPSSLGGIAFSPDGRRIAAAHYGGVSLRATRHAGSDAQLLAWKGSHVGVTWSPNGRFVLSAMQEDCLRGWRLEDKADLRMSGYPRKVTDWAWLDRGRHLVTNGADCAPCWPFTTRKGPMDQAPMTLGPRPGQRVTAVAGDPTRPLAAVGYDDGMVVLCRLDDSVLAMLREPSGSPVTALAIALDGRQLALGCEDGAAGWMPLPA